MVHLEYRIYRLSLQVRNSNRNSIHKESIMATSESAAHDLSDRSFSSSAVLVYSLLDISRRLTWLDPRLSVLHLLVDYLVVSP